MTDHRSRTYVITHGTRDFYHCTKAMTQKFLTKNLQTSQSRRIPRRTNGIQRFPRTMGRAPHFTINLIFHLAKFRLLQNDYMSLRSDNNFLKPSPTRLGFPNPGHSKKEFRSNLHLHLISSTSHLFNNPFLGVHWTMSSYSSSFMQKNKRGSKGNSGYPNA